MGSEILWPQAQVCTKLAYLPQLHTQAKTETGSVRGAQDRHSSDQVAEHTMFMFVKRNTTVLV